MCPRRKDCLTWAVTEPLLGVAGSFSLLSHLLKSGEAGKKKKKTERRESVCMVSFIPFIPSLLCLCCHFSEWVKLECTSTLMHVERHPLVHVQVQCLDNLKRAEMLFRWNLRATWPSWGEGLMNLPAGHRLLLAPVGKSAS